MPGSIPESPPRWTKAANAALWVESSGDPASFAGYMDFETAFYKNLRQQPGRLLFFHRRVVQTRSQRRIECRATSRLPGFSRKGFGLSWLGTESWRDSLLEEDGFELPVRGRGQSGCRPFYAAECDGSDFFIVEISPFDGPGCLGRGRQPAERPGHRRARSRKAAMTPPRTRRHPPPMSWPPPRSRSEP
jgi:hypothetical protein